MLRHCWRLCSCVLRCGRDTLPQGVRLSMVNANDGSCEGIDYPELRAFTVQFHPEACAGPHDMSFLFDRFTDLMKEG